MGLGYTCSKGIPDLECGILRCSGFGCPTGDGLWAGSTPDPLGILWVRKGTFNGNLDVGRRSPDITSGSVPKVGLG